MDSSFKDPLYVLTVNIRKKLTKGSSLPGSKISAIRRPSEAQDGTPPQEFVSRVEADSVMVEQISDLIRHNYTTLFYAAEDKITKEVKRGTWTAEQEEKAFLALEKEITRINGQITNLLGNTIESMAPESIGYFDLLGHISMCRNELLQAINANLPDHLLAVAQKARLEPLQRAEEARIPAAAA
jgi:hypothetical protein